MLYDFLNQYKVGENVSKHVLLDKAMKYILMAFVSIVTGEL